EEEGLIKPTARTAGGFRMYSEADIERVRLVRSMKAADLSIEELRELLAAVEAVRGAGANEERAAGAERVAAFVRRVRERLEILRGRMAETEEAALWLEALAAGDEIVADNPFQKPLPLR
ncbi:MAG TPA: MerR family transcriptional regulator, partial [Candidatus Limnocylindrales bacterium]|nr:MerR family transcriptional regulator [Candidatus Limnocylindrales bacterium]